ncbi:MAG: ATP-binding protein [Nocardioides sp.]
MPPQRRALSGWPLALVLLVSVYLAGVGAVLFAPADDPVASWWPAAGIAVALLLLLPRSWTPWLALGVVVLSGAANVTGGRDLAVSALFGLANAAEALVAAWVLRRGRDETPRLASQEDFVALVGAAVLGGVTIATGAALTVALVDGGSLVTTWPSVFASHAASTLVLVPVAMSLDSRSGRARARAAGRRTSELAVQVTTLALVTLAVFSPRQELSLTFVPLPFLVWCALRFDVRTVTWELAGFSAVTTFLTARGYGPFGAAHAAGRVDAVGAGALTQGYLLCAALMSLPLAIAVEQRSHLLARMSASERVFRRNFTESVVGMLLLRGEGTSLVLTDANDTAADLLGAGRDALLGAFLADVLDTTEPLDLVTARMMAGHLDGWKAQTGLAGRSDARVNVALSLLAREPEPLFAAQLQDVTAEHDALRRLEAAEKLTSATLDTTNCIILVTDLGGTIVRVNAATTELTGYTEAELLGRPVWETSIAPSSQADVQALFLWPNRSGAPATREADARTRSGEKLRVVWNNNIVRDELDRPVYAVMTGIDVTAERTASGVMIHLLEAAITTALIGIDQRGRISVFNSGAENLLGFGYLEMLGRPFMELLDASQVEDRTGTSDPEAAFDALTATIGPEGETRMGDWTWVASDGGRHTVAMTLSITSDTSGVPIGFLCVGTDVTEQRHGEEMLVAALDKERTAVERLRQLDEAKNEFVSTVSHELRTPVTSIVGYTEMLADGSMVDPLPEQLPMLDTIARNGQRLIVICNDLLLLSGLDSPTQLWEREALDLGSLLDPVEESLRPLLTGRDLTLTVQHPESPIVVQGDRAQLERVLLNLLSNAVKFTEDGGSITCCLRVEGDDACLVVEDTGIGIPLDEQSSLFEKFFRSSTAQQRAIQGTGLGLSIVAAIVAAHGGRVGVRSAHLEGTTFTVCLPLKQAAARRD